MEREKNQRRKHMKKASKLLMALLVVLLAGVFMGCGGDDGDDTTTATELTTSYQTLYLLISDVGIDQSTNPDKGDALEGFHFKNKTDQTVGMVIQEIFANNSKSESGKTVVFKWEGNGEASGNTNYWGFTSGGTILNGEWSSGEVAAVPAGETEVYITGFASNAFAGKSYVGIKVKNFSTTVKGDNITFEPVAGPALIDRAFKLSDKFKK
jgi:hypothetical protein